MTLFLLFCAIVYERHLEEQRATYQQLASQKDTLLSQRAEALRYSVELQSQLESHTDEEGMKLILMRVLGLVPEGEEKVVFISPPP